MGRILIIATTLVALVLASANAQTNTAIVAGQSIGGVRIGGNINDAIGALGNLFDREEGTSGKYVFYDWPLKPFLIIAEKESGRVVLVAVAFTDGFRTEKGVAGGSERQAVVTAYGSEFEAIENQSHTRLVYNPQGIAFFVAKNGIMSGRVYQIVVFIPGLWKEVTEG